MPNHLYFLVHASFFLALFLRDCSGQCKTSCGNLSDIRYPFWLKGDPSDCGDPEYELSCEKNRTILYLYSGKYYVQSISYLNYTIRILDPGLQSEDCSPLPYYPLDIYNFSHSWEYGPRNNYISPYQLSFYKALVFVSCPFKVESLQYLHFSPCIYNSTSPPSNMYYYVVSEAIMLSAIQNFCRIDMMIPVDNRTSRDVLSMNSTFFELHQQLLSGIELEWYIKYCRTCIANDGNCYPYSNGNGTLYCNETRSCKGVAISCERRRINRGKVIDPNPIYGFLGGRAFCGTICFLVLLIYKFRRRHLALDDGIEDFLQHHQDLGSIRYSYSDIKKMTTGFKEKLGQGGFGNVFKGKLRSGRLVAAKMLENSKSNGQDFMNEVATIGRIHHINVVQLIGFCAEGSKRALIYDFMPKGSLEKYIFPREENNIYLSWEKIYEIAIGVAQGIEYLHKGCEMQILHFDIKPHNILLDENFNPRISDFGLAKLYQTDDSIVTLTAVRGTMGYIAPELFYKNIGGVSYKADVYSFGMLLMEMAGRRKNLNILAENSNQIYFPLWVYDQLNCGNEMELGDGATNEERTIAKKLAMIALWCIQLKPTDRPSMRKVVEMLKSDVENFQMPPKLSIAPDDNRVTTSKSTSHSESLPVLKK